MNELAVTECGTDNGDEPTILASDYEPSNCNIGIVHIGFGAFHRAHQAVYVDETMQCNGDLSWGICAVNLRPEDSHDFNLNAEQIASNGGYLLKTTSHEGLVRYQQIRSHLQFVDWCTDKTAAESVLASNAVSVVTITVTESGYVLDSRGQLDTNDAVLCSEVAGRNTGCVDRITIYAYLAKALSIRASAIDRPLTICCCDNIRNNGHMLQHNFMRYLELTGQTELSVWVARQVSFPCSMVDRITPAATTELQSHIEALGASDTTFARFSKTAIHAESFRQWVLQDNISNAMPELVKAGVEITADVKPFEEAKIRILNGGHSCLSYMGVLSGYSTYDEAIADPVLAAHFDAFETEEVLVGLPDDLPLDKLAYMKSVRQRFTNSAIADTLERICMDGYTKMQIFIRPTVDACLKEGRVPERAILSIASWFIYARRIHLQQLSARYVEPNWHLLEPLLVDDTGRSCAVFEGLWADLPTRFPQFETAFVAAVEQVEKQWPL